MENTKKISLPKLELLRILFWFLWTIIIAVDLYETGLTVKISVVDSLITNGVLALASTATFIAFKYFQPQIRYYFYRFVWGISISALSVYCMQNILLYTFENDAEYILFLNKSIYIRFAFSFMVIMLFNVIGWLWCYIKEEQKNESRKADAEKLLREAELAKLQQQLQPHFLFNSLNSISALAGSKPEEARKMIQQLSDFLRGTLKKDENQLHTFNDEMMHLNLYLGIEKVRFGHRLNTEVKTDKNLLHLKLPAMLLQPVVENAIKFGLYDTTDAVTIYIHAQKIGEYLTIEIKNPFDQQTSKPRQGEGFGLSSVQRRLYLLYARNDLLATSQHENIYTTTLKIPQN